MAKLNPYFVKLSPSYLFPQIEKKVKEVSDKIGSFSLINLGIGDVTKELPLSIVQTMLEATQELQCDAKKVGYGPSLGFSFLRRAIAENDYRKCDIDEEEIFISNGAKCDIANIQEIFSNDCIVAVPDPSYPVYVDSNVMAGRAGNFIDGRYENLCYLSCVEENHFFPSLPKKACDVIYLCSPNNPTGVGLTYHALKKWVEYAKKNQAVIIFDGAYEAFITSDDVPHSIYEIEGAKEVAIEIRSFSKKAGFTGLRCSYTVVPSKLSIGKMSLRDLWVRRCETKFGGVPYLIQKAASAIYSEQGKKEISHILGEYKHQASILKDGLTALGYQVYGGVDAPYVWCKTPVSSWDFFDHLLTNAQIICIPGSGFGKCGERYVRFSAFAPLEKIEKALDRLKKVSLCAIQ